MRYCGFLLLFFSCLFSTQQPELNETIVKRKISEIMQYHVYYKKLTINLIDRILDNFLTELDPSKTYFIKTDIEKWTTPSHETKKRFLKDFQEGNYSNFNALFNKMLFAIKREHRLMARINRLPLPQNPNSEELKDIKWARNEQDLIKRLLTIKALQIKAASKLTDEPRELFLKRIEKYRRYHEDLLVKTTKDERKKLILSYILKATCLAMDAHTNYFTPWEAKQFIIQVQEKLVGIGALLKDSLDGFEIMSILEKSPAEKSKKLKIKDKIIAVDGKPVIGMSLPDAVELIRGQAGTKVILTVLRTKENSKETEKLDIAIIREEIVLDNLRVNSSYQPYADGGIAYLHLNSFYQDQKSSSAEDLKKALEKIQTKNKVKGVILDLRGNAGGLLPQAVAVAGLFIQKGVIVSIKDNTGRIQHLRNEQSPVFYDGPLIILINKASASAAEIVAQTLQDYGRALIVGDKNSFGKGSFQTFTLDPSQSKNTVNPEGEYKVTRGLYYTVSGKSPQLLGVQADIVVPGILSEQKIGEQELKYPLKNDSIDPSFNDDLTDIPKAFRPKVEIFYKNNLQGILTTYTNFLELLKENSQIRLQQNQTYQKFLKELKNKNFDAPAIDIFIGVDLQLLESYNILKDLIYFLEISEKKAVND